VETRDAAGPDPRDAAVPVADWLQAVAEAGARGDFLQAIDVASRGLAVHPEAVALRYQQLLAYARAGAGRYVRRELERLRAEHVLAGIDDPRLKADFFALEARILKDEAIRAGDARERSAAAGRAAEVYARVFAEFGGSYAAVNAATLRRVAGDAPGSSAMARQALAQAAAEPDAFWRLATQAEALCLLGDEDAAASALSQAFAEAPRHWDAIGATRRQLIWLSRVAGIGGAALRSLPAPRVAHWLSATGPGSLAPGTIFSEDDARAGVIVFGSLLSLRDCEIAEAFLAACAEINLTLPCAPSVCRAILVAREGEPAGARFDRILAAARNVTPATLEGDPEEPTVVRLAAEQARGQALIRAAAFTTRAERLYVEGGKVERALLPAEDDDPLARLTARPAGAGGGSIWARRRARALVFGDIKGFSALPERLHPAFFETVLGGFAAALAPFAASVEYAETAGDGLYVVASDVLIAVAVCGELQASLAPERLAQAGLPPLALRLSAHFGPVFPGRDPVTRRDKFFGKEVVRTARIEPVTPPGETYVTEQFAASLALAAADAFSCDYVGRQPMAKGFGECRMYALKNRGDNSTAS
jgi:tetratricopeptide (TPR) repeat protein